MNNFKGRHLTRSVAMAATMTFVATPAAFAESAYPERPITMVVPYAPGGGTDVVARLVAKKMGEELGGTIVVDNRPGAGGAVGTGAVAKAAADGYTILMGTASTHAINPALHKNLPYEPRQDFDPVALLVTVPQVVVINAKLPYQTLAELIEGMREAKGGMTYGSQGIGGIAHLVGEMVNRQAGVESTHVPYKGAAPALQDLVGGNIDIVYDTLPALLPYIQSGGIRALAVADDKPLAQLPEVPTTAAAGMPELKAATWNALFAPKGTPQIAIDRLSQAAAKALQDPELISRLEAMSAQPAASTPAELAAFNEAEAKKWQGIIEASGISIE